MQLGSREVLSQYLRGLERSGVLLPGAAGQLEMESKGDGGDAGTLIGKLESFLESPEAARAYLHPDRLPESSASVVRQVLERLAGVLVAEEHVDALAASMSLGLEGQPRGFVARRLVERLSQPEAQALYGRDKPPMSRAQAKVHDVLSSFVELGYVADRADLAKLSSDWQSLGRMTTTAEIATVVANRLKDPQLAAELCPGGTRPDFDYGDSVFQPTRLGDEARAAARDSGYDI